MEQNANKITPTNRLTAPDSVYTNTPVHGPTTEAERSATQQAVSTEAYTWRDGGIGNCLSTPWGIGSRDLPQRGEALHVERQRRVNTKVEEKLTRQSYQQGYVSETIRTRRGLVFRIRYRLRTADGKWMHKSETLQGLSGKKAARAVLDQRIRDSRNRPYGAAEFTVQHVVDALWRPYLDRKQVKPSTKRSYECELKLHILPTLGTLKIADVTPLPIEKLLQTMLENGSSTKTVRNLVGLLQSIFSLAVDNDLIPRSPVREKHKPRLLRSEKPVWTPTQLKSIVEGVPSHHRSLFYCAMLTGARLGELLGLQWKHVHFELQKLEIKQALWEGELVQPKTQESFRTIYFGASLLGALTMQKQSSNHNAADDFVFCKSDGSPLNPDVLRRDVLYPVLDRLGIARNRRSAGFHTFRHSAATIVNQKTGNLKLVQKLLGHSNLSTTADVYTHTSADADRSAALALEEAIFGDLFQVVPRLGTENTSDAVN